MKKWEKLEGVLNKISIFISASAFVIMIVLITANVITRHVFNSSINWAEEVAYLCFNWSVFFGVAIVYRYQGLTAIDILVDKLSGNVKKYILIFGYLLITCVNIGLIVWGTQFAIVAWERKSPALLIPYFFYDISIPLAAIVLLVSSVKFLIKAIRGEEIESAAMEDRA